MCVAPKGLSMTKNNNDVPENIRAILAEASYCIGKYHAETFSQNTYCELVESGMQSPIEYAVYIALRTVMRINYIEDCEPISSTQLSPGLLISWQKKIGKYKADFVIGFYRYKGSSKDGACLFREVVVECDGTAFHERTEQERRFEKCRDRYMQKIGLKVFRYTGKEILDDPYKIAAEIIGYVTDDEANTLTPKQYFE